MAGWPNLDRVDDRLLAQELRVGGDTALAQIYDTYAARLFDYCHALVRDQDLAADALHDSLIAAAQHIGKLREPERFRSWLYAIVRNECLRILRDPEPPRQRQPAPEETDDAFIDAEERQRRDETRRLVQSAMAGLSGRHREAIDLSIRHDLTAEEIAGVLGLSSQQAMELVAQARDELDNALAASIIARTGRADCPSVAALADEHEWPLPPEVCRKLIRHIDSCPTCRERRKRKVSTNRLMQVMPVAAMPSDLRMAVLSLAAAPDRAQDRARIAQRAEPFDVWGWPTNVERVRPARAEPRGRTPKLLPVVGAAAGVVVLAGAVFMVTGGPFGSEPAGDVRSPGAAPGSASDLPSAADSPGSAEPSATSPSPTPKRTSRTPTPTPTRTTARPRPKPTPSRTTKTATPTPVGRLRVTGCTIAFGGDTCDMTLTAVGGTVHWQVTGTKGVTVGRNKGDLDKGDSTTVTVTRDGACIDGDSGSVSVAPGGSATIDWKCLP